MLEAEGHAAISEMVAGVQAKFPGHRFRRLSGIDTHHDQLRFAWDLVSPEGAVVVAGLDIGALASDGRLRRITGFFGSGLTDMEGPAVKRVVTPPAISRSMLTCEDSLRMDGRFPEGAGARLTSGRLRRRIRLICAGYPRGQSRMTPLRRELPLSKGARHPDPKTGRRIVSARTLQSCLLPVAADATRETEHHGLSVTSLPMRSGADSRVPSSPPR